MITVAIWFSVIVLAAAFLCIGVVYDLAVTLPFWLMLTMQVLVNSSFLFSGRQARGLDINVRELPLVTRIALVAVGACGVGLAAVNFMRFMPNVSPSGVKAHSMSANLVAGVCQLTYNETETVEAPLAECARYNRMGSLCIGGMWLLFGSIGLGTALGAERAQRRSLNGG